MSIADDALRASHRSAASALTPGDRYVHLIAHRGAGHAHNDPLGPPENTLAAVQYGYAHGADAVEIDVWRTADGTIVLHHDATTDRTTDRPGLTLIDVPHAELKQFSAGRWKGDAWADTRIPTLAEVVSIVPAGRSLVIEIVEGPDVVPAVLEVSQALPAEQVMFITKNLDTAGAVKEASPHHRVMWIVDTTPRWQIGSWGQGHRRGPDSHRCGFDEPADAAWIVAQAVERGLDGLDTMFAYPPELPAACADAGLQWVVWTANDPRVLDACIADGVWGVTTDNTADVRRWLEVAGLRGAPCPD